MREDHTRIYGASENISSDTIKRFFNGRAINESDPVNAVMLQSAGSTIANDRDRYEREFLLPRPNGPNKILELGCGAGRLACVYGTDENQYLGVDFSDELIRIAKDTYKEKKNVSFLVAEVPKIDVMDLVLQPPIDLFVVTGLLIYLNDQAVYDTLALIAKYSAPRSMIYLRESLSDMDRRLTLKEFYSKDLGENYNAIYRTCDELVSMMDETLVAVGFSYKVKGDYAFPPALRTQTETAQKYFILERI